MKALSIKEPYASLIMSGKKTIETRKWTTNYRGDILLCASKNPKSEISGKAFAIARLLTIREMLPCDVPAACCDVYPGAYSWFLTDLILLQTPIEVKGKLGLFDVDAKIEVKHD